MADPDTCLAFALAGIMTRPVHSADEVAGMMETLNRQTIGLILITEDLARQNRAMIDNVLLDADAPLILEIPAVNGPVSTESAVTGRMLSLLRRS